MLMRGISLPPGTTFGLGCDLCLLLAVSVCVSCAHRSQSHLRRMTEQCFHIQVLLFHMCVFVEHLPLMASLLSSLLCFYLCAAVSSCCMDWSLQDLYYITNAVTPDTHIQGLEARPLPAINHQVCVCVCERESSVTVEVNSL